MATKYIKLELPDNSNELLYVKKVGSTLYRGYKTDYLEQNLTTIEQRLMTCNVCYGIMRTASLYLGETVCLPCSRTKNLNPVKAVQNSVATLKIKCPLLRNCDWKGPLSEAELHLGNCMYFVIQCKKCEEAFPREDKDKHNTSACPFRIVQCVFCDMSVIAKGEEEHLKVCDAFPLSCPNNCGNDFPREKLSSHRSQCELEMIECSYKEYGCEAMSMLRRDLLTHKKENIVEHTDLSLYKIHNLESELQGVKEVNDCLTADVTELQMETRIMKKLDGVELQIPNVHEIEKDYQRLDTFLVNSYKIAAFCRCRQDGGLTGIWFRLKRISGTFDRYLGNSHCITQCRIVIVNQVDYQRSEYLEKSMNFQLQIGMKSLEIFVPETKYSSCTTADESLCVRMYFDVNARPLENLRNVYCHSSKSESESCHSSKSESESCHSSNSESESC